MERLENNRVREGRFNLEAREDVVEGVLGGMLSSVGRLGRDRKGDDRRWDRVFTGASKGSGRWAESVSI
jgi:hypothetical protein